MCIRRAGQILAHSEHLNLRADETPEMMHVRFRTLGDLTITGAFESDADTLEKIIEEVAATRITERGGRMDDKRSDSAMETGKRGLLLIEQGRRDGTHRAQRLASLHHRGKC